jgi:tetratricopeptide (TPR) repeat protein
MDATPPPAEKFKKPLVNPAMMRVYIGLAVAIVVGVLGVVGVQAYKKVRHATVLSRAREFMEKKDYTQAAMAARWALDIKPGDPEAANLLAKAAEEVGARDAVQLQRMAATLQPDAPESYLRWANSALRSGDLVNARLALDGMQKAKLENAAYYDARARLADAAGQPELIEPAMAEAVRLEPANPLYRLRLASMQTGSGDPAVRERAVATIEELSANPETRRAALRVLLHAAMVRRDGPRTIAMAERLRSAPEARPEDVLVYLGVMRKAQRWEFWWALGQLQAAPPGDPAELTEIFRWLVRNNLASLAAEWGKRLPNETRLRPPVAIAVAEALTVQKDWEGLRPIVRAGEWGDLDFQRRALLARVLREAGDEPGSRTQWDSAVTTAGDRVESYETLMTLTRLWKWDAEQTALLWTMARGKAAPKPALDELLRRNLAQGRTLDLLAVFSRQLELDPGNPEVKNNVAYASLLLGTGKKRAETLALEAYRADPKNPGFAATHGFALYSAGRYDEGLQVVRTVADADLAVPANAMTCGLLLAATGARDEARLHLAVAQKGPLLPEEKALVARALEKLAAAP